MRIKIDKVVVGEIETNCYIVTCVKTGKTLIIDPGDDYKKIYSFLKDRKPEFILNTHGHIDHIKENDKFDAPVYIHLKDKDCLTDPQKNLSVFFVSPITVEVETVTLKDRDIIKLGELRFEVLHTPGHTVGSVSFKVENLLFSGDTLFCGGYGRTDFPGGSEEDLFNSIKKKLLLLSPDTIVYPGHGLETSIENEKKNWATF